MKIHFPWTNVQKNVLLLLDEKKYMHFGVLVPFIDDDEEDTVDVISINVDGDNVGNNEEGSILGSMDRNTEI